jgi:hypothetical protein
MLKSVSKRLVVFAGLLAMPVGSNVTMDITPIARPDADPRMVRLQQYLAARDCPLEKYATDFIEAADANDLDWRLLPSISVIESGGGKEYINNNVFGWDSCRQKFPTIRAGIHLVASRLANSQLYRGKDLEGKLRTYNPAVDEYPLMVQTVMRSISPASAMALN